MCETDDGRSVARVPWRAGRIWRLDRLRRFRRDLHQIPRTRLRSLPKTIAYMTRRLESVSRALNTATTTGKKHPSKGHVFSPSRSSVCAL